jgi:hypothetical protein
MPLSRHHLLPAYREVLALGDEGIIHFVVPSVEANARLLLGLAVEWPLSPLLPPPFIQHRRFQP